MDIASRTKMPSLFALLNYSVQISVPIDTVNFMGYTINNACDWNQRMSLEFDGISTNGSPRGQNQLT